MNTPLTVPKDSLKKYTENKLKLCGKKERACIVYDDGGLDTATLLSSIIGNAKHTAIIAPLSFIGRYGGKAKHVPYIVDLSWNDTSVEDVILFRERTGVSIVGVCIDSQDEGELCDAHAEGLVVFARTPIDVTNGQNIVCPDFFLSSTEKKETAAQEAEDYKTIIKTARSSGVVCMISDADFECLLTRFQALLSIAGARGIAVPSSILGMKENALKNLLMLERLIF